MEKVAVSKGILVGLAAGLFLSVLAIGFFIGRETARKATNFGSISVGTVGAPPPAQPEIVQHPPVQSSESSVVGPPENFSPSAMVESVEPPPSPANPGGSPNEMDIPAEPVRTAVVAYFSSVDQIQLGQMRGGASESSPQNRGESGQRRYSRPGWPYPADRVLEKSYRNSFAASALYRPLSSEPRLPGCRA